MKTLFFLCSLLQFILLQANLFAQEKVDFLPHIPLKPLSINKEFRPIDVSPNVNYDSLDNSNFCKSKANELLYLRTKLFAKLDSANKVLIKLNESNPGSIYYLEVGNVELFNYEGCFARINKEKLNYYWLEADVINCELRIKEEGLFHNNSDGSSGWTKYRNEIRKEPK